MFCNVVAICSLLFQLLLLKMAIGLSQDLLSQYVNLEAMVRYGNLPMIKGFLNGSGVMQGKELLLDKSGWFRSYDFSVILKLYSVLILRLTVML